jgi:hypothetical protein
MDALFKVSKDSVGQLKFKIMSASASTASNYEQFQESLKTMKIDINNIEKIKCNWQKDGSACGLFAMENVQLMANASSPNISLQDTFSQKEVVETRRKYGQIYVEQKIFDAAEDELYLLDGKREFDFSQEEKSLKKLIKDTTISVGRISREDREEKGSYRYNFKVEKNDSIGQVSKSLQDILEPNYILERNGNWFYVPRKDIKLEELKMKIETTDKIINAELEKSKLNKINVLVVDDNAFLPTDTARKLYNEHDGNEFTLGDLLNNSTAVLKLKRNFLKTTFICQNDEQLIAEAALIVNQSSLLLEKSGKWKVELKYWPELPLSQVQKPSISQKKEKDLEKAFEVIMREYKVIQEKHGMNPNEVHKWISSMLENSQTSPELKAAVKSQESEIDKSKDGDTIGDVEKKGEGTINALGQQGSQQKRARDEEDETDPQPKRFKTQTSGGVEGDSEIPKIDKAKRVDDIEKHQANEIKGKAKGVKRQHGTEEDEQNPKTKKTKLEPSNHAEVNPPKGNHLNHADKVILSRNGQSYNLLQSFAVLNNNLKLLHVLDKKAVITTDIDLKSISVRERVTSNKVGSVQFLAEGAHEEDHAGNIQSLIENIESKKIGKDTVIAIERKQYGENLGVKDAILLADVLEHNEKHPNKKLQIPEEITKDSLIYYDAVLYNTAKKHGVKIIGLEGKNLKTEKTSPEGYNKDREEYMSKVINEVSSRGYDVIAYVGAAHVKGITAPVNAKSSPNIESAKPIVTLEKHKTPVKPELQPTTGAFLDRLKRQPNNPHRSM